MKHKATSVGHLLQAYFTEHLVNHKNVSSKTIESYRDAFRLLLIYINDEHNISPDELDLNHITPSVVIKFLNNLEKNRKNSIKTRVTIQLSTGISWPKRQL
jgi:site-specific recombinase XerD